MSELKTEWAQCPARAIEEMLRWVTPKMLAAHAMQSSLLYPLIGTEDADGKPVFVAITIDLMPSAQLLAQQDKAILKAAGVSP